MPPKVVETIRRANRPGPPEHSVALRLAACGSVCVGVLACQAQGELSGRFAAVAIALTVVGSVVSHLRRRKPLPFLKLLLAGAMIGAFVWFFLTVSAANGDLATVEGPLAALFTAMQVAHSFDVPSRRDLGFSLAGSASLMAVAAAQAISPAFGILVLGWAAFVFVGLASMWGSMAGGAVARPATLVAAGVAILVVAVAIVLVLPAPRPLTGLVAAGTLGAGVPGSQPSRLVKGSGVTPPARAATRSGPTRVGGYLGFAGPLDTATRSTFSDKVVLRVRADRPTFWIAETYDTWNGQSWSESAPSSGSAAWRPVDGGSPFAVPAPQQAVPAGSGTADYQTFYLATSGSDLILHAATAEDVWFPSRRIFVAGDGSIKAGTALGAGSIYTVLSRVATPTPAELSAGDTLTTATRSLPKSVADRYLQLPDPYPRVAALAARVTAGQPTVYGKVQALESWIGAHTTYTTDIPPLAPGQDTVDQFLFGNRKGYCEQISTSLAVMLRTLGIPAREATGYVPGPYDPITDLYDVEAKDAHAWVQVWFPGYGWQSFDPTAFVPLANPTPADVLGHDIGTALGRLPVLPTVAVLAAAFLVVVLERRRRRRPATWAAAVTRELERAARRAHLDVEPSETLGSLADRLDRVLVGAGHGGRGGPGGPDGDASGTESLPTSDVAARVARAAEESAWGGTSPDGPAARDHLLAARRIRRAVPRRGRRGIP